MSKSLGNGVDPVDIANRMGGEIVRLWVASIDFREDMAASENLMHRCAELYRKLRNTFRFLLGNLTGFDPARDRVPEAELLPLDQYMLARTRELTEKILGWYADFEFHRVYQAINDFAIVDLSSFYLDVLKDRMYTFAPTSHARRSAQTVLWQITETLVRLVAPILSFTADEVWEYLPPIEDSRTQRPSRAVPQARRNLSPMIPHRCWKSGSRSSPCAMKPFASSKKPARPSASARVSKPIYKSPRLALSSSFFSNTPRASKKSSTSQQSASSKARPTFLSPSLRSPPQATNAPAAGTSCPKSPNYGIWQNVCTRCHNALREMGIPEPPPEATQ